MIATRRPPLLKRLPAGVWVGSFWSALVLMRSFQRPDELRRLLRYHGNIEDAPLLVTAVVTTLGAFLLLRAPLAALAVALAGAVFSLGMEVRETPIVLFLLADAVVGYIAATRSRRISVLAAALPVAVLAGDTLWRWTREYSPSPEAPVLLTATTAIAWLIGNTVHQSRAHADTVRAQATHQAVTAERLRIARELHDMVAHNIGIIAIQAGMGSRVMDTQPAETRRALEAIEATSRETLAGLRRMLGALRRGDQESAPLDPVPGLAALGKLVSNTAAAGVSVEVRWRGAPRTALRHRPGGFPHHPGVGHQRGAAFRHPGVRRDGRAPGGRTGRGHSRPRTRRRRPVRVLEPGRRLRDRRHAGAGDPAARGVQRRSAPGRRVPRGGAAAGPRGGGPMIRVVLVDDQPLIRTGLRVLIADTPGLEVVGEAGDGEEAVELVRRLRPDVAIMDIRMPGTDGIEATRRINADPESRTLVLVLTTFDDDAYVYGALRAGASGFLVKDMPLETILDGIRVLAAGDALIAPSVTRRLIGEFAARPEPAPGPRHPGPAESRTGSARC